MKNLIYLFSPLVILLACQNQANENDEMTEAQAELSSEWITLFDGTSTDGWRKYNGDSFPTGWVIEDDALMSLGKGDSTSGDIVYAKQAFENFEFALDWKVSEGANSGILYHVKEGDEYPAPYHTAPEFQLIDDISYGSDLEDWQSSGADYAMYTPDSTKKIVKSAGEWNSARIVFTTEKVEYWLNGKMVLSFVPWSEDWQDRRANGKWNDYPDYGKFKSGLICLQDHGNAIWFRDIKIREL